MDVNCMCCIGRVCSCSNSRRTTTNTGFSLESNRGEVVSLSDYAGEIVVLNFWATWCPHCRSEMPELQKLHDYFEETGAGKLLLINQIDGVQETRASAAKYLADNGYDLLNLYDDHTLVGYYILECQVCRLP